MLAFDLGLKRTGVASGELSLGIAHPLTVLAAESTAARLDAIGGLVAEWRPVLLVLGLPTHADGTPHEMTRLARKFAQRLHGRFGLPVWLVDERHSSQVAEVQLNDAGLRGRRQKPALDQVAAQVILQSFLDMPQAAGIEPL